MPSLLTKERSSQESESERTESESIRGGTSLESEGTLESTTVSRIYEIFHRGPILKLKLIRKNTLNKCIKEICIN